MNRRDFLELGAAMTAGAMLPVRSGRAVVAGMGVEPFRISLAQWSLHRTFFGTLSPGEDRVALLRSDPDRVLRGPAHPINFPVIARRDFGIDAVEYVNTFMYGHGDDQTYLRELNLRARGEGVTNVLIMCDLEGALGDPDPVQRRQAVTNHVKWLRAAAVLGCHAIRVNAEGQGAPAEQSRLVADGLHQLAQAAEPYQLHVLVENHGGLSSQPSWLMATLRRADHPLLGTLPDFGNFPRSGTDRVDPYQAVEAMMPLARAVSAKSYGFGADGTEDQIDFDRMMTIVTTAGYHQWVGIEYEGDSLSEFEGIRATQRLLQRIQRRQGGG